jgi:hypothetical protein
MQQRYHITIFKIWQEKFETLRTFLIPFLAIPAATFSLTSFHAHTAITQKHKPEPNRFGSGFPCAPGERTFYRVKVPNPPGSGKD